MLNPNSRLHPFQTQVPPSAGRDQPLERLAAEVLVNVEHGMDLPPRVDLMQDSYCFLVVLSESLDNSLGCHEWPIGSQEAAIETFRDVRVHLGISGGEEVSAKFKGCLHLVFRELFSDFPSTLKN